MTTNNITPTKIIKVNVPLYTARQLEDVNARKYYDLYDEFNRQWYYDTVDYIREDVDNLFETIWVKALHALTTRNAAAAIFKATQPDIITVAERGNGRGYQIYCGDDGIDAGIYPTAIEFNLRDTPSELVKKLVDDVIEDDASGLEIEHYDEFIEQCKETISLRYVQYNKRSDTSDIFVETAFFNRAAVIIGQKMPKNAMYQIIALDLPNYEKTIPAGEEYNAHIAEIMAIELARVFQDLISHFWCENQAMIGKMFETTPEHFNDYMDEYEYLYDSSGKLYDKYEHEVEYAIDSND